SCGIHPFAEDVGDGSERSAYVNINCLDGIDLAAVQIFDFDGRSA
ncbi:GFA family protein, partial [Mesorhizobium sp. M4B.F.Ca.ET.017.02.2.1]